MRTVVATLSAITLLLGICVWLTAKDSSHSEPSLDRVQRDAAAVVAPEHDSAAMTTLSAPTAVPRDKPVAPTEVPPDKPVALTTAPPDEPAGRTTAPPDESAAPTYPPVIALRKWLVDQLVDEGLAESDSERTVRVTMDRIAECRKVYYRLPERQDLYVCTLNAIQEGGMLEAFRHLDAEIKASQLPNREGSEPQGP